MSDLASIEQILNDAKAGKMFILVDDEDRENEGDLVIPAEFADAEAVNFMAKYGRGLICLAMDAQQIERLGLPPMSRHNSSRHQTAFTVSIEAREGVSTGISAADRARTIAVASNPESSAADIATPGHVFPLEAREGGVLVRAGHTEAAVDISKLAGLSPSGVICEIMNDDGSMARLPDLAPFAKAHGLNIATIADLIAYRRQREKLIERQMTVPFTSQHGGEFHLTLFTSTLDYAEHIVLTKGAPGTLTSSKTTPTLVRMHAMDVMADMLFDASGEKCGALARSMEAIEQHGSGAIVIIREPNKTALSDTLRRSMGEKVERPAHLRNYGIGAQILLDLGIHHMTLLTNHPRMPVGLEGYGIHIENYQSLDAHSQPKQVSHG